MEAWRPYIWHNKIWMKFLCAAMLFFLFSFVTACGKLDQTHHDQENADGLEVVTTFFPLYDFAAAIGGDEVNVVNLIPAGVEPHDWEPRSADMVKMVHADVFLYNGAGLEGWVDSFLKTVKSESKLFVQSATEGIDLIRADETDEHAESHHADQEDKHHHGAYDPHAWLSPLQAKQYAYNIKEAFVKVDPERAAIYEENYEALFAQLEGLHKELAELIAQAPRKEIVSSHQSYAYMARDYGLEQFAIMGLSPEAEPTRKQISEISAFIREREIRYIFTEQLVSPRIAEVLASDLGIETLVLNPVEGLTKEQEAQDETYISLMHSNLKVLKKALYE